MAASTDVLQTVRLTVEGAQVSFFFRGEPERERMGERSQRAALTRIEKNQSFSPARPGTATPTCSIAHSLPAARPSATSRSR
jgi:hypothetical protein